MNLYIYIYIRIPYWRWDDHPQYKKFRPRHTCWIKVGWWRSHCDVGFDLVPLKLIYPSNGSFLCKEIMILEKVPQAVDLHPLTCDEWKLKEWWFGNAWNHHRIDWFKWTMLLFRWYNPLFCLHPWSMQFNTGLEKMLSWEETRTTKTMSVLGSVTFSDVGFRSKMT